VAHSYLHRYSALSSLACPDLAGWHGWAVEQGCVAGLRLLEHLRVGQAVEQDVDDGGPLLRSTLMVVLPTRPPWRPLRRVTTKATPSCAGPRRRIEDGHSGDGSTFSTANRIHLARPHILSRVERRAPHRRRLKVSAPLHRGRGALVATSHSECETRLDGMAATSRRIACSQTNRQILRSRSARRGYGGSGASEYFSGSLLRALYSQATNMTTTPRGHHASEQVMRRRHEASNLFAATNIIFATVLLKGGGDISGAVPIFNANLL
jgi:hypothetical protein